MLRRLLPVYLSCLGYGVQAGVGALLALLRSGWQGSGR
jgi:hypothetical protein